MNSLDNIFIDYIKNTRFAESHLNEVILNLSSMKKLYEEANDVKSVEQFTVRYLGEQILTNHIQKSLSAELLNITDGFSTYLSTLNSTDKLNITVKIFGEFVSYFQEFATVQFSLYSVYSDTFDLLTEKLKEYDVENKEDVIKTQTQIMNDYYDNYLVYKRFGEKMELIYNKLI